MKYRRIFVIVMDSLGVGEMPDAHEYGDQGANTLKHIYERYPNMDIPTLKSLGFLNLIGINDLNVRPAIITKMKETSIGKDTLTGHWEIMGLYTDEPLKTFTDTGFPEALIKELELRSGHKIIGNISASGTEIIKQLGKQQKRDNSLIVYTSADSVLQIAAHEETTGLDELYRVCEIARELTNKEEWKVGRIIARPFLGNDENDFYRTPNRHDYAVSPADETVLDLLKENGYMVSAIGKINDIFNGHGVIKTQKTISNDDGMDKAISELDENYRGLCFVNLVDFDSKYGHRRDVFGYKKAIEEFDKKLSIFIDNMKDDDLLILTADHGNDPTCSGSDHTREKVPFIGFSTNMKENKEIPERDSFADIGASILYNFDIKKPKYMLGKVIDVLF